MGKLIIAGVVSGAMSAAAVDLHAFKTSAHPVEDFKTFNWKLAGTRWVLGGLMGALGALGLGVQ